MESNPTNVTAVPAPRSAHTTYCLRQNDGDGEWYLLPVSKLKAWTRLAPKIEAERCSRSELLEWKDLVEKFHLPTGISSLVFGTPEILRI